MYASVTYILYLVISITLTVWVGRTLFKNGRIFLVDAFHKNEEMADSVNHLLIVGFYLLNAGFIALFLRNGFKPETIVEVIETISTRVGVVLIVLGGVHYFNMFNIARMRRKARKSVVEHGSTGKPATEMV